MNKKFVSSFLPCLILLFTTGCWDRVEIEERGFTIGVTVDLTENDRKSDSEEQKQFAVMHQIVVPGAFGGSGQGNGTDKKPFFNVIAEGNTIFHALRGLAGETSRTPYYEHLKIIILSEEIARSEKLANSLDLFIRDHEMRRGTKVMIADGKAQDIFDVTPPNEKLPVMYIDSVVDNAKKNARMLEKVRIGDVHEFLLEGQSFALPRISKHDQDNVKITGAAIFQGKSNKLVGFLKETETIGLNFMTGKVKSGVLETFINDDLIAYEIKEASRKIKADVNDKENMNFTINIETEGNMGEAYIGQNFLNQETIANLEKEVEKEIERLAKETVKKLQNDFKVDVIGLGNHLRQTHYPTWKTIENNWDYGKNYFVESNIEVKANVTIRRIGAVDQTKSTTIPLEMRE
ncbi:Ger(x)C family spore germination protein [Aquibacillus albus]|uniref:Spore germination protein n=1 Tax=Aquibacillus albus TaxID=1168171 RepID=A0ABS2N341_9BACI|nr:spore germination protein [Aquibacillus albus]